MRDGNEAPTRLVLEPTEHLALGAFVVDGVVRCTAALIDVGHARHFVVTAKHCFEDETDIASTRFVPLAELEQDPDDARSVGIAELHLHPEVDAAVVELDQAIAGAQPFAVAELGAEDLLGRTLEVAGAGLGSGGGMRFGTFEVVAVTSTRIEVRSDTSGQCAGDSGGPWFQVDGDGGGEIVAVASTSAPSCGNPAFGVRLDPLIGWIYDVTRPDLAAAEHSVAVVWPDSAEVGCAGSGTPLFLLGFALALLRHRMRRSP